MDKILRGLLRCYLGIERVEGAPVFLRWNERDFCGRFASASTKGLLSSEPVVNVTVGKGGDVWFMTCADAMDVNDTDENRSGGVSRYKDGQWTRFTEGSTGGAVPDKNLMSMSAGLNGDIWVGSFSGVSRYKDGQWTRLTAADGLLSNYVYAVAVGPDDSLWVGTDLGIVQFYDISIGLSDGEVVVP